MQKTNKLLYVFLFLYVFACGENSKVAIIIGNKKITDKKLSFMYKDYMASVDTKSVSKASFVSHVVEKEILEDETKKMGIVIPKEEEDIFLKENNIDERKRGIVKLILLRKHVTEKLMQNVTINEEMLEGVEKNILDVQPDKVIFYQILVNKKEIALQALDEIKKGIPFEDVVKKYSQSPEKNKGGLVDYLNADELPSEILMELKKMKPGDVSPIVTSPYGFHILKLKEFIKKHNLDKESKRKIAMEVAKKMMVGEMYGDWIAKKRKEYGVQVKWDIIEQIN